VRIRSLTRSAINVAVAKENIIRQYERLLWLVCLNTLSPIPSYESLTLTQQLFGLLPSALQAVLALSYRFYIS
jgi:hypothetical protein